MVMREIIVKVAALVITVILFYGVAHARDWEVVLLGLVFAIPCGMFTLYILFDKRIQTWPVYKKISASFESSHIFSHFLSEAVSR